MSQEHGVKIKYVAAECSWTAVALLRPHFKKKQWNLALLSERGETSAVILTVMVCASDSSFSRMPGDWKDSSPVGPPLVCAAHTGASAVFLAIIVNDKLRARTHTLTGCVELACCLVCQRPQRVKEPPGSVEHISNSGQIKEVGSSWFLSLPLSLSPLKPPSLTLGLKVSIVSEIHVRVTGWGQGNWRNAHKPPLKFK